MFKAAKLGLWCSFGGIAAMVVGVAASGGFGPAPFVVARVGVAACAVGILAVAGAALTAGFRKNKNVFFDPEPALSFSQLTHRNRSGATAAV